MNDGAFSLLLTVFNPKVLWLTKAIDSVLSQSYQSWQLCIVDDASTDLRIRELLKNYSERDQRIKVCLREINGHISEASNSALEMASGEWIVLMDHDDILPKNALEEIVKVIEQNPEVRLIYSDEDKTDESGNHFDPYFKSDWNRDLFYSHNVVSHLGVYHMETVRKIGGFRKGFEGSQDHDLALRVIEQIRDDQIHHIPKILYHWRSHSESTASTGEAKPYTVIAGERAINDHLQRTGSCGSCTHDGAGGYRVRYPMPERKVAVSTLILSNGNVRELCRCIDRINRNSSPIDWDFRVLPATSRAAGLLKGSQLPPDTLLEERGMEESSSAFLNRVARDASGEVLWFLHDRLEHLCEDGMQEMISHALRPEIGAVGGKLYYPDGRVRQAGLLLDHERISRPSFHHWNGDSRGYMGRLTLIQNYSAVSKDCLMIEKGKFLEVGGFDQGNLKSHHLDVDLCLRLKDAGYRTLWTPYAKFCDSRPRFSLSGIMNRFSQGFRQDSKYMRERWERILESDPAYNPNLNQKKKDFSFKSLSKENG
jgi:GT2 family glycosyltransferase